jgi:hypothetical protein
MQIVPPLVRPLPAEQDLDGKQIEDSFLRAIRAADFLYIYVPGRYVGEMTGLEVGFALGERDPEKPVYISEPAFPELAEGDLERQLYLEHRLVVAGITEAVQLERLRQDKQEKNR